MIQSIYTGVIGLQSFQTGIDVLANNIANVNTIGFKGSRTEFADLFEKTYHSGSAVSSSRQVGLGTRVSATALDLSNGAYILTESTTDLAIAGEDGWFGLTGLDGAPFFSRNGNFHFDPFNNGTDQTEVRLVNQEGLFVTGTLGNNFNAGVLSPSLGSLELSDVNSQQPLIFPRELSYPVEPTSRVEFFGNLGLENVTRSVGATIISPQNERNNLRLVFTKSAIQPVQGSSWDIVATTGTADGSTIYDTQTGIVTFDEFGQLLNSTLPALDNNGVPVIPTLRSGFNGMISNDGPDALASTSLDGTLGGELISYSINRNGEVLGNFDNGKTSVVGKVAIYHFQNDQGLEQIEGNLFRQSSNSGKPIFYTQDNGSVLNNTLENSNVALDTALTELIILQRSYDATAKTITTSDQMLQYALRM